MSPRPVFLSPALPSELLTYILDHFAHPTTLIICSHRDQFLSQLSESIRTVLQAGPEGEQPGEVEQVQDPAAPVGQQDVEHTLLSASLYQIAVSRHIRIIYVPTVTHLRAYLSVFTPEDSRIPSPPASFRIHNPSPPHLLVYGFLSIHQETSEWSAQGLSSTAAALVETGHRLSWQVEVVDPPDYGTKGGLAEVLSSSIPVLSGSARRPGPESDEGGWSGRTTEVGHVLGRWFQFQRGEWDVIKPSVEEEMQTVEEQE